MHVAIATVRLLFFFGFIGLLAAPQTVHFLSVARRQGDAVREGSATAAISGGGFSIQGKSKGLYPGLRKPLKLRVRNLRSRSIRIKVILIAKKKTGIAGCPKKFLNIKERVRPNLVLLAGRTKEVKVWTKLKPAAPNACKRAKFPLSYAGTAVLP